MLEQKIINECARECDSFYFYEEKKILASIKELKEHFPQIEFLYSMKCNSNPQVLESIFSQQFGADAASLGEVRLARDLGVPSDQIFYSAPGKSRKEIESAMGHAMLIADSLNEIKTIQAIAESTGQVMKIGIRIHPSFSFEGEKAKASKFGIDEEQAAEFIQSGSCNNIQIVGIHVHLKSQVMDAGMLSAYYQNLLKLAKRFAGMLGELAFVNMGSGMGIQYALTDTKLDTAALSKNLEDSLTKFRMSYPNTRLLMEVGRYAVGKSGVYVTRVMDRKISCGKTYLLLKNTLNGFLRPSLERLITGYCSEETPSGAEPLFTCKDAFAFIALKESEITERVTLVGNLCTATDVIAEDILLPQLDCGDLIAITNAGSYAAVLSPVQFSLQDRPKEFFLRKTGEVVENEL